MDIQGNYYIKGGLPSEPKYLDADAKAYDSVNDFIARVPVAERHDGLTFKVQSIEYWLDGGVEDSFIVPKTNYGYRLIAYGGESILNIDCRKRPVTKILLNGVGNPANNFSIVFNNLPNQSLTDLEFYLFIPNMAKGAVINFSATLASDKQVDVIDVALQQPGIFKCLESGSYFLIFRYIGNFLTIKREGPFGLTTRAHLHVDPNKSSLIYIDELFNKIPFSIDDPFIPGGRNIRASDFFTLQSDQPVGADPTGVESGRGNGIVFNGTYNGGFASFKMGFQQIQELYIDLYLSAEAKWWFGCMEDENDVFEAPNYMFIGANLQGEVVDWPLNGDILAKGDGEAHLVHTDTDSDGTYRIRLSRVFNQNNFQVYVNDVLATSFNITDTNPDVRVGFRTFTDFISIKRVWIKYLDPIEYYTQQEIVSVPDIDPVTVKYSRDFETEVVGTALPETVEVTLEDASTRELAINWNPATYNPLVLGTYTVEGQLVLTPDLINPGFQYSVDVTVEAFQIVDIPEPDPAIEVPYNTTVDEAIAMVPEDMPIVLDEEYLGSTTLMFPANWDDSTPGNSFDGTTPGDTRLIGLPDYPVWIENPSNIDIDYPFVVTAPKTIDSVAPLDDITVPTGTPFGGIGLPAQVEVTYDDLTTEMLNVNWSNAGYNPSVEDTYAITGQLVLPAHGVSNPLNLVAEINVIVEAASSTVVIPDLAFGVEAVGTYGFSSDEFNEPPIATQVTITGTPEVGSALTMVIEGLFMPNGAAAGTHVYRWYRSSNKQQSGEELIAGATNSSYTVTIDDDGKYIRGEVDPKIVAGGGQNLTGETLYTVYTAQVNDASFNPFVDITWFNALRPSGAVNLATNEYWINEATGENSARDATNAMPAYNGTLLGVEFTRANSQRLLLDQPIVQFTRPVEIWMRFRMKTVGGGFQRLVAWTGNLYVEVQNDGSLFLAAGDTAVNVVTNTWYVCRFVLIGTASASKFTMNNGVEKTDVGANTSGSFGTANGRIGCASSASTNFSDFILSHLFVKQGELTTEQIANMWSWFNTNAPWT